MSVVRSIDISQQCLLPSIFELPFPAGDTSFFHQMDKMLNTSCDEIKSMESIGNMTKGTWTGEEDEQLRKAVLDQKPIVWDIVAEMVPGRTAIQCKERWLYRLHPEIKKTRFEQWEDDLIVQERSRYGNHWTLIANKLPGRTSCAVKNRWYSVLRNRYPSYDD